MDNSIKKAANDNESVIEITGDTLNQNTHPKTNSKKKKGIIGRSSNKNIKLRRKICKDIIQESPAITRTKFISLYKAKCKNAQLAIPSKQTIMNDARNCKIVFSRQGDALTPESESSFNRIGYDIGYYLNQIRVLRGSYDIMVFDARKDKIDKSLPLKKFFSRIKQLYPTDINTSDNYEKPDNKALSTILLIFKQKGLEKYIENIFEQEFNVKKSYLYTETSSYCFKIVFEFENLNFIMKKVYEILEYTQPSYFSKP